MQVEISVSELMWNTLSEQFFNYSETQIPTQRYGRRPYGVGLLIAGYDVSDSDYYPPRNWTTVYMWSNLIDFGSQWDVIMLLSERDVFI